MCSASIPLEQDGRTCLAISFKKKFGRPVILSLSSWLRPAKLVTSELKLEL
jgi:hypothetical protein